MEQSCEVGSQGALAIALVFSQDSFSEPLTVPARIVWSTELDVGQFQVGMSFLSPSAEQRRYVDIFVRYLEDAANARTERVDAGSVNEQDFGG